MRKIIMAILSTITAFTAGALPTGFTYINDPHLILEISYVGNDNFIGRPIDGYKNKVCIMTQAGAKALLAVQDELNQTHPGYVLKIFDTYRPTKAVAHFVRWSEDPHDQIRKTEYYPDLNKPDLFKFGYIGARSSHSRGSTVDLTIAVKDPNDPTKYNELDMGTMFDYFHETSHADSTAVSQQAQQNRKLLKDLMLKHGFTGIREEWWHFTLRDEPFPDTYFDFDVA
jgi:D-alanyl-D-alanine dipeptidase